MHPADSNEVTLLPLNIPELLTQIPRKATESTFSVQCGAAAAVVVVVVVVVVCVCVCGGGKGRGEVGEVQTSCQ